MQYCTLDDAWGNKITTIYYDYMNNSNNTNSNANDANTNSNVNSNIMNNTNANVNSNIMNNTNANVNSNNSNNSNNNNNISYKENFENNYEKINISSNNKNNISSNDKILLCDDYIYHIKNCKICQDKIKNYLRPNIIDNLYTTIDDYKDIIVLILIGICILLFFNLIINITK